MKKILMGFAIFSLLLVIGNSFNQSEKLQAQQQTTVCCYQYDVSELKVFFFRPVDAFSVKVNIDGIAEFEAEGLNNYIQLDNPLPVGTWSVKGKTMNSKGEWSVYGPTETIVVGN
jgi:hypothetical protein